MGLPTIDGSHIGGAAKTTPEERSDGIGELQFLIDLLRQPANDSAPSIAATLMTQYHSLGKIIVAGRTGRNRIDGIDKEIWSYLANFAKLVSSAWQQEAYRDRILPTSAALLTYLQLDMNDLEREYFRVLFLDSENKLLADKLLWEGTVDSVHAYPREILRHAIGLSATALILVHNHVSSDPSPSNEDIRLTQHVIAACEPVDIVVHDHLIIARNAVFSLAQNACIQSDYAV